MKTLKLRIKDKHTNLLTSLARQVNFVWNYGNALSKTTLAKSVHDAAWSAFRTMLRYKCENAKVLFKIVNETYSSQVCSCCSCIGDSSPKGRTGLRIREWSCLHCGTVQDRDISAAKNILALGHERPVVGIPLL